MAIELIARTLKTAARPPELCPYPAPGHALHGIILRVTLREDFRSSLHSTLRIIPFQASPANILYSADQLKKETEFPCELDVLKKVMEWKQRRQPPLKEDEVALSICNLAALKWVQLTPSNDLPIQDEFYVN